MGVTGLSSSQIALMSPAKGLYGSYRALIIPDSLDEARRGPIWELTALIVPESPNFTRIFLGYIFTRAKISDYFFSCSYSPGAHRGPILQLPGSLGPR